MERLKKPSTIAALTWLKDRWVSMKVPESRAMIEKAIEELGYRIPKKPDTRYEQSRHQYIPICPTCNDDLDETYYCPTCGQAIDTSYFPNGWKCGRCPLIDLSRYEDDGK